MTSASHRLSRRHALALLPGIAAASHTALSAPTAEATGKAATEATDGPGGSFLIRDVRIFDGRRVSERGSVLVLGGRIAGVGRLPFKTRHQVYDGRGRTLLPGMIDSHVHSFEGARADALRFGVTTELDMFHDPAGLAAARRQRRSLAPTTEADLWSAGTGVTVPGGHPLNPGQNFPRVTPETDIDRFVGDRIAEGSDYVKFIFEPGNPPQRPLPSLTAEQVAEVIDAAHRRGRMAVGHAEKLALSLTAARHGADGLVHAPCDLEVSPAEARSLRRSGVFVVPTLSVVDWGVGAKDLLSDERVHPWLSDVQLYLLSQEPVDRPGRPDFLKIGSENVRRLHAAGVPILAGTDAPIRANASGVSMLAEVSHLVNAGLSPSEALTAATAAPAYHFGLTDRGRIAPGLRADLVLVDGDPTTDITDLRAITTIWKNGHPVDRTPPTEG